ncbi:hypothetical protein [Luteibacter sp. UNCMF331Sha3.1]|uniref:hypothetical protein n=1 Tax=Luteibacter sp. UNCMF331Sha3.1 TaxID=1502760 RepID=UPI0011136E19|nr:hypothetical protein [Luteibacter sp. UNCMF331Sha3.1]
MSKRTLRLESAIGYFAQCEGVSAKNVDRLRALLEADSGVARTLTGAVEGGRLRGFSLGADGAPSRSMGHYDRASGIVTLPPAVFADISDYDLNAVLRVQAMMVELSAKQVADGRGEGWFVTQDMLDNLQNTINQSPVLVAEMGRATMTHDARASDHRVIESFDFVKSGGLGGSFDTSARTMNFVPESLMTTSPPGSRIKYNAHDLTFVIGHEIQHGFNAKQVADERSAFIREVRELARTPGPIHDYTQLIEQRIRSARNDEAIAEIAGWNALISRVQSDGSAATLANVFSVARGRAIDFVELPQPNKFTFRDNLDANTDLSIDVTPANIEAMGYNYFDRPVYPEPGDTRQPMHLGPGGVSDYRNYYAGWAVATIAHEESKFHRGGDRPEIRINMRQAGLDEEMMERAGLNLRPAESLPYLDSSTQPSALHRFDHTADGPNRFKNIPIAADAAESGAAGLPALDRRGEDDQSTASGSEDSDNTTAIGALVQKHDAPAEHVTVPLGVAPRTIGLAWPGFGRGSDERAATSGSDGRAAVPHDTRDAPGRPADSPIFGAAEQHRLYRDAMRRQREEQAETLQREQDARDERRRADDRAADDRTWDERAYRYHADENRYRQHHEALDSERRFVDTPILGSRSDDQRVSPKTEAARRALAETHAPASHRQEALRHASRIEGEGGDPGSRPLADRSWERVPESPVVMESEHERSMREVERPQPIPDPSAIDAIWLRNLDTPRWDEARDVDHILFQRDDSHANGRTVAYDDPFPHAVDPIASPGAPDPYANIDPADPFSYNPYLPGMPEEDKDMADMWLALQSNNTQAIDRAFDKLAQRPEVQQLLDEAADILERERIELAAQRQAALAEQRRIDEMIRAQREAEAQQHGPVKVLTLGLQPLTAMDIGGGSGGDGGGGDGGG